ncbi:hypothetical protein NEUTE1DRAFT_109078 [Neurospora tetrasperma FGSC 2508]|uniref:Uncharacterized protein n=1 Tax=Neurospora tetrasperma (strain FGSC 2508 / ATCC MYA-4615 / P0657) TaxID=510951 RepID=F8MHB4_NEUT8|nr:uncharacterized protein NEUTE1DRAFT_109078 [Neurospora tetrasperma FGSC 2508]EGO59577.1 hypothetical protein NEUTE1DRAFT_109078 [Neurospora tetrasperma FGSC 2508]EGZ73704.1 hypothetical protein NEUTE2DRAFT_138006 [Neurospora tetrasperma FGSC 2509]
MVAAPAMFLEKHIRNPSISSHKRDPQKYLSARPLAELHRPLCTKAFFTGLTPQGENNRPKHNPHEQACHLSDKSIPPLNLRTHYLLDRKQFSGNISGQSPSRPLLERPRQYSRTSPMPGPCPQTESRVFPPFFASVPAPLSESESDFALHDPTPTSIPDLTSFPSYIGQDAIGCPISSHSVRATSTSLRPCHGFIMTVHLKQANHQNTYHPLAPSTKAITGRWKTLATTPPRGCYYLYESKSMTPLYRQAGYSQIAAAATSSSSNSIDSSNPSQVAWP